MNRIYRMDSVGVAILQIPSILSKKRRFTSAGPENRSR